jgi:iron(III) transport system substrate-binding protein
MRMPQGIRRSPVRLFALLPLVLLPLACDSGSGSSSESETITLYTCVSDETIQPVISEFEAERPGTDVKLYRATTGDLNARVAADERSGGLRADVIWACDPLTMQGYVDQNLVGGWTPSEAAEMPDQFRTDDYVGVAVLYMVAVYNEDVPAPSNWSDLTDASYAPVAVSDPAVAASALGALGYFSQQPDYGLDFYSSLEEQGGKQLSTPDEVTTGVAQGLFTAGMTIANSAYLAKEGGSPIGVAWPEPGGVAIYGPIALANDSADSTVAKDFISYVVSEPGQQIVAEGGSYPALPGVEGPELPADAPVVFPDWPKISADQDALLSDYQQIFGS